MEVEEEENGGANAGGAGVEKVKSWGLEWTRVPPMRFLEQFA